MRAMDEGIIATDAARALLAFWRASGVDMEEAEAVYAGALVRAAGPAIGEPRNGSVGRSLGPPKGPQGPIARLKARPTGREAPVETARALARSAKTIAELQAAVENFDGCALKATARNTAFADGVIGAPVLLLGEAPGKEEDEQGRPFVGRSGQLLDRMLAQIGLSRKTNLMISNTIYWRPPGNRDPTQGEIVACLPFVERLIELSQPKLLLLAGKAAAHTVLKREDGVMKLRGRRLFYSREDLAAPVNAMVMLHPAYLLRQPQQKRLAWADLLVAEAWLKELAVELAGHP